MNYQLLHPLGLQYVNRCVRVKYIYLLERKSIMILDNVDDLYFYIIQYMPGFNINPKSGLDVRGSCVLRESLTLVVSCISWHMLHDIKLNTARNIRSKLLG